jgi:uncharacterized membrane protein YgcG
MTHRFSETAAMLRAACLLLYLCATGAVAADGYASIRANALQQYPGDAATLSDTLNRADRAGVPADMMARMLSRSTQAGIPANDFAHMVSDLSQAAETGLPVEPLGEKVMEGLAKEVAPALIVQVLDRKLATYREAQRIVAEATAQASPEPNIVEAVALSFERGITAQGMHELLRERGYDPASVANAAQALADLVSMGFKQSEGVSITRAGLDAGYLARSADTLTQVAAQAQKQGLANDAIARRMADAFNRGTPMAEISLQLHGGAGHSGPRSGYGGGNGGWGYGGAQSGGGGGNGPGGGRHAH